MGRVTYFNGYPGHLPMTSGIVLAMHGAPPRDFPHGETAEMFGLHARLHGARGPEREALVQRHDEIEGRMREWPRTPDNDPFWSASHELAEELERQSGLRVVVGFNEFCNPSIEDAVGLLVSGGAGDVLVMTPMMTRGGEHSEVDIPTAVDRARKAHPGVSIRYAWPYRTEEVASFLVQHSRRFSP
jgi:sirohydrochlorin cobaltochelatase